MREGGRRPRSRQVHYFRLRREYDRTGTFTLGEESGIDGGAPDYVQAGLLTLLFYASMALTGSISSIRPI